jgi:hypothetical protein
MRWCIDIYEASEVGPVCCFYISKVREIPRGYNTKSPDFRNFAEFSDDEVIGCSRGCLPIKEGEPTPKLYKERLCKECVAEARELLKSKAVQ